jgi:hypothetical protein
MRCVPSSRASDWTAISGIRNRIVSVRRSTRDLKFELLIGWHASTLT